LRHPQAKNRPGAEAGGKVAPGPDFRPEIRTGETPVYGDVVSWIEDTAEADVMGRT
jgi:hypothetical protein